MRFLKSGRSGLPRHQTAYNLVARVAFAWQRSFGETNVGTLSVMGGVGSFELFFLREILDVFRAKKKLLRR